MSEQGGGLEMAEAPIVTEIKSSQEPDVKPASLESKLHSLLKEYPQRRIESEVVGQHRRTEPIAEKVAEKLATSEPQMEKKIFPDGYDYKDVLEKARQEVGNNPAVLEARNNSLHIEVFSEAASINAEIAKNNPDKIIYNFHEGHYYDNNGYYEVQVYLPTRLVPRAVEDFNEYCRSLADRLQEGGIPIILEAKSIVSELHDKNLRLAYNQIPPNMVNVEMCTPASLYEKVDPNLSGRFSANRQLKTGPDILGKVEEISDEYAVLLKELLPVIGAEYSKYLNDPRSDMLTYDPNFTTKD